MLPGDERPMDTSVTGQKRHRLPKPAKSRTPSPTRDEKDPSSANPVVGEEYFSTTKPKRQPRRSTSPLDTRLGESPNIVTTERQDRGTRFTEKSPRTSPPQGTSAGPSPSILAAAKGPGNSSPQDAGIKSTSNILSLEKEQRRSPPRDPKAPRSSSKVAAMEKIQRKSPSGEAKAVPTSNVPASNQQSPTANRRGPGQQPASEEAIHGPSAGFAVPEQRPSTPGARVQGQRSTPSKTRRALLFANSPNPPPRHRSAVSREQSPVPSNLTAQAEEYQQTEQMLKVISELRKLNDLFDSYPSSSGSSGEYDPSARVLRHRVLVDEEIVDELETELIQANMTIWNNPESPSRFEGGPLYDDEIQEVLQRVSSPEERYRIFQERLKSLHRPAGGAGPGEEERKDCIRRLKLVIQEVWGALAEVDRPGLRELREQEVTSNVTAGNASRVGGSPLAPRPRSRPRGQRLVNRSQRP